MYIKFFKRFFDFFCSLLALIVLSPLLIILIIVGSVTMRGNPFFTQKRPGKIDKKTGKEKIFVLIKFRTMSNKYDSEHNLLPDEQRLTKYGRWLRGTSLDELPELINILLGQMSIIGPRPLLVKYLPLYSEQQHKRHNVRPGLTGYAQVNGRNAISWEEKFNLDIWYVTNISFALDIKILFITIKCVLRHQGISSESAVTMEEFTGTAKTKVTTK